MPNAKQGWGINSKQWIQAENFLKNKPNGTKIERKKRGGDISFIKIENQIFAMANKKFFDPLGEGGFGKVKMIENKEGVRFAVKIEGREARGEEEAEKKIGAITGFLIGEASRTFDVPKMFKGKLTEHKLYTVMQLQKGKEVAKHIYHNGDYVKKLSHLNDTQKLLIALKCCQSIQKLHDKRIIHADIKPGNFVADINGNQIILGAIDFGLSLIKPPGQEVMVAPGRGTSFYMAPELKDGQIVCLSNAADVFALGTMFERDLDLPSHVCQDMLASEPTRRTTINSVITKLISELENRSDPEIQQAVTEARKFVVDHEMQTQQQLQDFQSQFTSVYLKTAESELARLSKEMLSYEKAIRLYTQGMEKAKRDREVAIRVNEQKKASDHQLRFNLFRARLRVAQQNHKNIEHYVRHLNQRLTAFKKQFLQSQPESASSPPADKVFTTERQKNVFEKIIFNVKQWFSLVREAFVRAIRGEKANRKPSSPTIPPVSPEKPSAPANNEKVAPEIDIRPVFINSPTVPNEGGKKEEVVEPAKVVARNKDRAKSKLNK